MQKFPILQDPSQEGLAILSNSLSIWNGFLNSQSDFAYSYIFQSTDSFILWTHTE